MAKKAPGKAFREGITIVELFDMFPDEAAATAWFESVIWPEGRHCPKCGSCRTREASHKKMPYWCTDCRSYFSVKTGTAMQASKIPLRKWAIAIYFCLTNLKSVSSVKLHRDLGVSQATAWFMLHRIRQAWAIDDDDQFDGPVEVDESYFGGKRENMSFAKREELREAEVGRERRWQDGGCRHQEYAPRTKSAPKSLPIRPARLWRVSCGRTPTKARPSIPTNTKATPGWARDFEHEAVNHSVGEYVRDMAHTNGMESFWIMLKRAHKGTFHKISPKHLERYVDEFAGKHNIRNLGTIAQMRDAVARLVGRRLLLRHLVADNGLSNAAG